MKATIHLQIQRTYLRNLVAGDAQSFYFLNVDPEVLREIFLFKAWARHEPSWNNTISTKNYGTGRLAVIDRETDAFLGCG